MAYTFNPRTQESQEGGKGKLGLDRRAGLNRDPVSNEVTLDHWLESQVVAPSSLGLPPSYKRQEPTGLQLDECLRQKTQVVPNS